VLFYAAIAGVTVVVFMVLVLLVDLILPRRSSANESNTYDNYPPIIELRKSHWQMGDRPPRN
jgi:hypothetical protein